MHYDGFLVLHLHLEFKLDAQVLFLSKHFRFTYYSKYVNFSFSFSIHYGCQGLVSSIFNNDKDYSLIVTFLQVATPFILDIVVFYTLIIFDFAQ